MIDGLKALQVIKALAEAVMEETAWTWDDNEIWRDEFTARMTAIEGRELAKEAMRAFEGMITWHKAQVFCPRCNAEYSMPDTQCRPPEGYSDRYCDEIGMIINLDGSVQNK